MACGSSWVLQGGLSDARWAEGAGEEVSAGPGQALPESALVSGQHAQTLLGPTRQALDAGKGFWVAERNCRSAKRRTTLRRSAAL